MPSQMNRGLEIETIGEVTVATLAERRFADPESIQAVAQQLFDLVDEEGRRNLVVNFRRVVGLSSAVLGKLVTLHKKVQAVRGRLVLCNLDPMSYEMLEIVRLNKIFEIWQDAPALDGAIALAARFIKGKQESKPQP